MAEGALFSVAKGITDKASNLLAQEIESQRRYGKAQRHSFDNQCCDSGCRGEAAAQQSS